MATRQAATDAQFVSALQASQSGDVVEVTDTGDRIVSVAGLDCRPNGVTVRNAAGADARIKTGTTSGEGFRDCWGLNFTGLRFATTKFWGGGDIHIVDSPKAMGLYFQGDNRGSSVTGSFFSGGGFGITLDGRRPGRAHSYVEDFTIDDNDFAQIGVDPIRAFGLRRGRITNNRISDVSSWRYSGDQTTNRLHSDGMDLTQLDDVLIQGNTFDLIEWQAVIIKNHGYRFGWPQHLCRGVVIEGNTFGRIGHANFPEIGVGGGGCGIFIQDCHTVTVKDNIDVGGITRAGLNWFHLWAEAGDLDPAYGTYNSATDTIDYHVPMQVFAGGNTFERMLNTPPTAGWKSSNGPTLLPLESAQPPAVLEFVARDAAGNLSAPMRVTIPIA